MAQKQLKALAIKTIGLIVVLLSFVGCERGSSEPPSTKPTYKYSTIAEAEKAGELVPLDRTNTVAGIDADNNGIRDDIERYIDSLKLPPNQTSALRFLAYTYQEEILADLNDKSQLELMGRHSMDAVHCFNSQIKDDDKNREYFSKIRAFSLNTRWRTEAYFKFLNAMSGSVIKLNTGDTCEKH